MAYSRGCFEIEPSSVKYRAPLRRQELKAMVPAESQYWELGPKEWEADYDLLPESLDEVCLFKCMQCSKTYFIWQPT